MSTSTQLALAYDIILLLLMIMFIGGYFLFGKYFSLSAEQRLLDHVIWLRQHSLHTFIYSFQKEAGVPNEYCIRSEIEENYVKAILSNFEDFVISAYFKKELLPIKSKYVINDPDYFAKMLWNYLHKFSCDNIVAGYEMHEEQLSQQRYGEYYTSDFDATYSLTPFAITYYKLYYIVFSYLGKNPIFNKKGTLFQPHDAQFIKETLDTNVISVSYRQQF